MPSLQVSALAPLVNSYTVKQGPPHAIIVPQASKLPTVQDLTVNGILLQKQSVSLDPQTNRRKVSLDSAGYSVNSSDGDLHFDLGTQQLQPHIACELQNATPWLGLFTKAVGQQISVSGFFRCLFEHPGFDPLDDAHIFEIHPVKAVSIGGQLQSFDVQVPEQKAIHTWTKPNPLNQQDSQITVSYDRASDTLTFKGMQGKDENYVQVSGQASNISLNTGIAPSSFTLASPEIGHPVQAYCLQGTTAAHQLRTLAKPSITMVGLRNIDLSQAMQNRYAINLLAINIL